MWVLQRVHMHQSKRPAREKNNKNKQENQQQKTSQSLTFVLSLYKIYFKKQKRHPQWCMLLLNIITHYSTPLSFAQSLACFSHSEQELQVHLSLTYDALEPYYIPHYRHTVAKGEVNLHCLHYKQYKKSVNITSIPGIIVQTLDSKRMFREKKEEDNLYWHISPLFWEKIQKLCYKPPAGRKKKSQPNQNKQTKTTTSKERPKFQCYLLFVKNSE